MIDRWTRLVFGNVVMLNGAEGEGKDSSSSLSLLVTVTEDVEVA
jgi:hypothetical protein